MANAVTARNIIDGDRNLTVLLTGVLDTANESATAKIDVSALAPACAKVTVKKITYSVSGSLKVILAWDATTDVTFAVLAGQGEIDFQCAAGGVTNNAGTGVTGDVMLSTVGYASGTETYFVLIEARKEYA